MAGRTFSPGDELACIQGGGRVVSDPNDPRPGVGVCLQSGESLPTFGSGGGDGSQFIVSQGFFGGLVKLGAGVIDSLVPGGSIATGIIKNVFGGGGGKDQTKLCPDGVRVPLTQTCFNVNPPFAGPAGVGLSFTPTSFSGGGSMLDFGEAVKGQMGLPALEPAIVGQRLNGRGEMVLIRQCPPGAFLSWDNLCYNKGSKGIVRKWKRAPKPPMSAADAKALRRIGTLQTKVKKLAGDAGLSCKRR